MASRGSRENGAVQVGLVAPYLPYMRQDKIFSPGEIVSARHFAALLSDHFDWLVTVDPHLHRIANPSDIFSIPAVAVHAATAIARWAPPARLASQSTVNYRFISKEKDSCKR